MPYQELTQKIVTLDLYSYYFSKITCQRAWMQIDLDALVYNVTQIKNLLSTQTSLMAVVKADGYGHGGVAIAKTVLKAGANALAVATLMEGIELREAGIDSPILVLGVTNTPEEVVANIHWNLEATLCCPEQAFMISRTLSQYKKTLSVHLKLDTGMSRLGTPWYQGTRLIKLVQRLPYLTLAGIYSHLAASDDPNTESIELQHQRFETVISNLKDYNKPCLHFANSAATLNYPQLHYSLVRVGLALYGLYPSPHLRSRVSLRPILQVKAKITQIKTISQGTKVSYGHQFTSKHSMIIAIVSIGYADGVPRNLSNRLQVLIHGQRAYQIGAITMDQLILDISHLKNIKVGDIVTLIGKDGEQEITADDWASELGTISWEILCGFKRRLPRVNIQNIFNKD
ncbi:alanine racemase [Candidatus Atelocyanobacterium thalassae]|uniref:Alanine racemase n=1 Tax=cyanobacterium endosymbiont of Braarudosphaera bigelowii TaxID=1285375 RepID=A0ABM7U3P2_9CHRO|nr:alanine racemase [Candidatus Atelocyanobacterium thalassa]BDA39324.1 alanine racemase [cyanobacterium endosymbiont of Braarudosphaera bigelowii]